MDRMELEDNISMWIDWKLNNRLSLLRDQLLDEYIEFNNLDYLKGSSSYTKVSNAISCILNNLSYSVRVGNNYISVPMRKESFSKPVIYNAVNTGRKVSYVHFMSILKWLEQVGYAEILVGGVVTWKPNKVSGSCAVIPDQVEPSILIFNDYLYDKIKSSHRELTDIPTIPDVIQIKDSKKKVIEKNLGREGQKLLKLIDSYNFSSRKFEITVGEAYYDIQLRKVFNNSSWRQGGRSYVVGDGSRIMNKTFRKDIRINGKPTVEIDFKALHPSIIAEMQNYKLPEFFDPYGLTMDGYDEKTLRHISKIAFMCIFNSKNIMQATSAVSNELRTLKNDEGLYLTALWKEQKLVPKVIEVKQILQSLAMHNIYAQDFVFSGKGVYLQNTDSRIMDLVIQQFLDADEFMLPVHDSIIVEERLKDFAINSMRTAYRQVLGTDLNCVLEVK